MDPYILLTAVTLSLDTFAAGTAYGIKKIRFTSGAVCAFVLTGLMSAVFAAFCGSVLTKITFGGLIGGVLLMGTGAAMILQQFDLSDIPLLRLISSPEKGDLNKNSVIDAKEAFCLALALSLDSCAACAGSVAGGVGFLLPFLIFVFQPVFLRLGYAVGQRFTPNGSERICAVTAGIMLISLGLGNVLGQAANGFYKFV